MRYYKIIRGYSAEDYIEIDETELEKAYASFILKKDAIYSGGAVRGSEILAIQPDYHRAMGWNRGYKLTADDYAEISNKGVDKAHISYLGEVKDRVHYLITNKKLDLIGKNQPIPELNKSISDMTKQIAEKLQTK